MAWIRVEHDYCSPSARKTVEEAVELAVDWISEGRDSAVGVFEIMSGKPVVLGWVCLLSCDGKDLEVVWLKIQGLSDAESIPCLIEILKR
jgi:hypothetical protein